VLRACGPHGTASACARARLLLARQPAREYLSSTRGRARLAASFSAFADLKDPEAINQRAPILGRDEMQYPSPGAAQAENGGFSGGASRLPVAESHLSLAVDVGGRAEILS